MLPVPSAISLPPPPPIFGLDFLIFLGISKPNSKTIRNLSANPWPSFPRTLGQWCRAGGGVCEGSAQSCPAWARRRSRAAGAWSPARSFPTPRSPTRSPRAPPESQSPAGALRPSRRPARPRPPAALSADRPRSAALGLGPGPGAVLPPVRGPARVWPLPGGAAFFSLKGPVRKGKGLMQRLLGLLGHREERPGAAEDRLAPFPGRSAEL